MAVPLLDQFGRPTAYIGSDNSFGYSDDRMRMQRPPEIAREIATLLSRERHRMLIKDARYIRRSFPLVNGAVEQKADYVSSAGWLPAFDGEDEVWGDAAAEVLGYALDSIDVRGPIWDWDKLWHLACATIDTDGDFFVLLGESESGWPQLQMIESYRVGSVSNEREVLDGPYKGLTIINGVIYNKHGREVAYRVLDSAHATTYRDISARDMIHVMDPAWFSDGRAAPSIAYSVLDWYEVKETRALERTKAKANAAITMVETNEEGKPGGDAMRVALANKRATAAGEPTGGVQPRDPVVLNLSEGMIRYVRSGGGDLKAHVANTPSDQSQRFDEKLIAGAFYGMGWRVEMMDLSKLNGGAVRGFADNINTVIAERHKVLAKFVRKVSLWALAKLINFGQIEPHPEWQRWSIPTPPEFTPDPGRAGADTRDNIRVGLDSVPAATRRLYGRSFRPVLREQARWLRDRNAIAEAHGLRPEELGTFSQPGDQISALYAQPADASAGTPSE
jgi:capsid protein